MTESEKEAVRTKVRADNEKFMAAFAPLYLGKTCPLKAGFTGQPSLSECGGPECPLFLLQANDQGKISGGACSIPLIASQVGPIAAGMEALAFQVAQASGAAPKILAPPAGGIGH